MTTLPEEAVKAAMDEFNRTRRFMTSDTDRIYAAIAAALPHLPQGVGVKKLGWNEHGCATTPFGMYTVEENVDDTWSFTYHEYPFGMPEGEFSTQEAAKSAAQADYEARILSALEPSNKPGTFDLDQISPDQRVNISRPESQRTLEPSATRELVLEERLQAIEQQLVVNLGYFHDEKRILLETLQSHIISHISAIRALSSPDHADAGKVEGDGWLPIESAPKDGTEIIYLTKYGSIGFCRYAVDDINDWFGWWDLQADDEVYPKHWLPRSSLPSAPSQEVATTHPSGGDRHGE